MRDAGLDEARGGGAGRFGADDDHRGSGGVGPPKVVTRKRLAPGVVYRQINDAAIPIRMYELTFAAGTAATIDDVL